VGGGKGGGKTRRDIGSAEEVTGMRGWKRWSGDEGRGTRRVVKWWG